MRLWSVHPRYLDRQALAACWREGLLAQAVITKSSGGYSNHPQLERFRACEEPLHSLGAFLGGIVDEADARGYNFVRDKILRDPARVEDGDRTAAAQGAPPLIPLAAGQLDYEWGHLLAKLQARSPERAADFALLQTPDAHPIFEVVPGGIASWERPGPILPR